MMKVVTAEEMQNIDRTTIEGFGVPGLVLMERAGQSVAKKITRIFRKKKVIVLSGGGNNGGDGIVVARNLKKKGWNVRVFLFSRESKLSPDCREQCRLAKKIKLPIEFRTDISEKDIRDAIVVDALLGTGISKSVRAPLSEVISVLNRSDVPVVAVDIPSGISSDNGRVMGDAVRADYTVTFGLPKMGHVFFPGKEYTGELFIEDIGFPEEMLTSDTLKAQIIDTNDAERLLPERPAYSHKGDYGHVLIVAGSRGKTGAAFMAGQACLRSGAGMVTLGVPETLVDTYHARVTEEMVLPLPDTGNGTLHHKAVIEILDFLYESADVLAVGPGIGVSDNTEKIIFELIRRSTAPMVIDADGLNAINTVAYFKKAKSPIILTPHPGEMARLLNKKTGTRTKKAKKTDIKRSIEEDRINTVRSFSKDTGVYLALKGAPTVIAEPEGNVYINTTGNPGMAKAGSGDVLTGIIAAFLGQGLNPLDATALGTYIHGRAGDAAALEKGLYSVIATDIIEKLPVAFSCLMGNEKTHLS
jgi:NAD(P)H-hydrate epimerase